MLKHSVDEVELGTALTLQGAESVRHFLPFNYPPINDTGHIGYLHDQYL